MVVSIPGGEAVLGMARGETAELAEVADLVDVDVRIAGEIEQRIEQHRAVTVREHEAVPVGPVGARGIELEEAAEEHGRDIGKSQRCAGWPERACSTASIESARMAFAMSA